MVGTLPATSEASKLHDHEDAGREDDEVTDFSTVLDTLLFESILVFRLAICYCYPLTIKPLPAVEHLLDIPLHDGVDVSKVVV